MERKQKEKKALPSTADIILPAVIMGVCTWVFFTADGYRKEARMFPQVVAGITAILCLMLIIKSSISLIRAKRSASEKQEGKSTEAIVRFWHAIVGVLLYPAFIILLGFIPATLIYLPTSMWLFGYRNKKVILLVTILLTAFMYVLFGVILSVKLPVGLLFGGAL